jgi:hypothetical protein
MADQPTYKPPPKKYDLLMGSLHGRADVTKTKPSPLRVILPMIGTSQTFIVQTYRDREDGDTIFIEYVDDEGTVRLALPPAVSRVIARQRDALTASVRKRVATESALARKAAGKLPAFLRGKKQKQ